MIQEQVLNKILQDRDSSIITLNNLTTDYFSDYPDEYSFIYNHIQKYSVVPDMATFLNVFPDFSVINVQEPTSYLLEELMHDKNKRFLAANYSKVRQLIMDDKVDDALAILKEASEQSSQLVSLNAVNLIDDTSRYLTYEDKLKNKDKYFIKTGFKELDNILGGWDVNEDLVTIVARNGLGKCLEKGTKVLMADGSAKKVEDVVVGDKIQSKSGVNNVLALHNGISDGYTIKIDDTDETFTVSENHILTLIDVNKQVLLDLTIEDILNFNFEDIKKINNLYLPIPKAFSNKKYENEITIDNIEYYYVRFHIESIKLNIEYYGFMCDGDHRYIIYDNRILTHNTWVLLKCAAAAAKQGKKVGIYSGEMSEDTVGYRIDTLIGHISNGALVHGGGSVESQYKNFLEGLRDNIKGDLYVLTPKMINGPAGVSALRAFIERYNLDILFIDQHSLLEDDRKAKNPVEKASNISKDLKLLQTIKRIPIIAVSQQNRTKLDDGKTFDTTQLAQSDRIA